MQAITNFDFLKQQIHEVAEIELSNEHSSLLADKWRKMGSELETHNFPKQKIAKKVRELVESERFDILIKGGMEKDEAKKEAKLKSGYYYRVMSSDGYTDQSQNRRSTVTLGEQGNTSDEKLLDVANFGTERQTYIQFMKDIKEESENIIKELNREDVDWQPLFESPEMSEEFFALIRDMFYNELPEWNRVHDKRQSILPKMLIPLVAFKALTLDKKFCSTYFAEVKKGTTISPKKYSFFLKDVASKSDLLHYVKEDAWLWNFIDIACPLCKKSLKVRMFEDGTWQFICKNWKVHSTKDGKLFPATLLGKQLSLLRNKFSADKFLQNKGIITPKL